MTTAIQPVSGRINPLDGIGRTGGNDVLSCLQGAGMDFNVGLYPVRNAITGDIVMGAPRTDPKGTELPAEPRYFTGGLCHHADGRCSDSLHTP